MQGLRQAVHTELRHGQRIGRLGDQLAAHLGHPHEPRDILAHISALPECHGYLPSFAMSRRVRPPSFAPDL